MHIPQAVLNLSVVDLRAEVSKEYTDVAHDPKRGYHFLTGVNALTALGYDETLLSDLPQENIDSFAGTGNPLKLGQFSPGETVVDVGSGSGVDALIVSGMVGPAGRVIGIDMTDAMLEKARAGAEQMGASHVEFRKGLAEELPLPDELADVVISNGVLNLTTDKVATLREWARVLKPGGRLQVGDIVLSRPVPQSALDDISLWTG